MKEEEKEIKTYSFTRLPEFQEPFIIPEETRINNKKHIQTCLKNKKKRKKRRR